MLKYLEFSAFIAKFACTFITAQLANVNKKHKEI